MYTTILTFTKGFTIGTHKDVAGANIQVHKYEKNKELVTAVIYEPDGEVCFYGEGAGKAKLLAK